MYLGKKNITYTRKREFSVIHVFLQRNNLAKKYKGEIKFIKKMHPLYKSRHHEHNL